MKETNVSFNTPKLLITIRVKKKKSLKFVKPIHPIQAIHSHW